MQHYNIRELRLAKGWSQEQLAAIAGLSTRTIQRIENGHQASLETLGAIAAALGVQVSDLASQAPEQTACSAAELAARRRVENEGLLLSKLLRFVVLSLILLAINGITQPQYWWSLWAIGAIGLGLVMRAARTLVLRDALQRWQTRRLAQKLKQL
ncbi:MULTISPECIES: helix-turn-helix domain-containing protein [Gibbsiella]|uniref:Helix-turn-helix domain-containing protein n=1 Tax=Gibbsiella dentisursi TaxID=796890 RepID=A0ABP7LKL3_9GAMM|nr:helix-turn-helix domain-containing protein [Gibbsiella quercinecans]